MITHDTPIRVRYADTDQMRFVYYGKYFEYFEQGRSELLRSLGMPYPEIEKMGILLPVIEACSHYKKPAHYDDLVTVRTIVKETPVARLRIDYEVYRDDELLAEGYTIHSFLNIENGKPTRAPQSLLNVFEEAKRNNNKPSSSTSDKRV